jgi:hypothetical protein
MRKLGTTLLAALAIATGGFAATGAQADDAAGTGPDNVIWVKTTGTNTRDQQAGFQMRAFDGKELRSANVARADSTDCTGCRTVAVAVQTVFTTGKPTTVAPTNAAIAINQNCQSCVTYAYAWQYVVPTSKDIRPSRKARAKVANISDQIDQAAHSDLAPADLDARLNTLTGDLKATIDAELARQGEHSHGDVRKDRDDES